MDGRAGLRPILFIILVSVMAYSNTPDTSYFEVNKDSQEWFEAGEWYRGVYGSPDASIDKAALYKHYSKYKDIWDQVFDFMRNTNLEAIETGKYPIAGDSLFVIVDEYVTQDVEERKYEAHRKYIDLQYIIEGKELIGVAELDEVNLIEPYDGEKDIAFYEKSNGKFRVADSSVFFIFFPDDAHQPCVKFDQARRVKKIVFKIISD